MAAVRPASFVTPPVSVGTPDLRQPDRRAAVAKLRLRLQAIAPAEHPYSQTDGAVTDGWASWGFGVPEIDGLLSGASAAALRPAAGLHEIKPAAYPDRAATTGFALAILSRRLLEDPRPVLWVFPRSWRREHGHPYGPGLAALGLATDRSALVETRTRQETLWAMEEGIKSGALAAVLGILDSLEVTPARRLVLAASGTPCFAITDARTAGVPVAHSRWRVGAVPVSEAAILPSDPPSIRVQGLRSPLAPTRWRAKLTLERCRHGPARLAAEGSRGWLMEWCDASFRLHLVAGLPDHSLDHRAIPRAPSPQRHSA
jgi:protein ImuA